MKEIVLEILKSAKERLKYPIITVYIIVLIFWNWDVLSYYFLSDSPIEEKINYIEKNYYDEAGRIVWPLLKSVLLMIIFPCIMLAVEYPLHEIQKRRRKIKNANNTMIREDKLAAADHEFKMDESRTGKKTLEDWENKVNEYKSLYETELKNSSELRNELLEVSRNIHKEELLKSVYVKPIQSKMDRNDFVAIVQEIPENRNFNKKVAISKIFNSILSRNDIYSQIKGVLLGENFRLNELLTYHLIDVLPVLVDNALIKVVDNEVVMSRYGYEFNNTLGVSEF